jgi:hypothetical protein
MAHRIDDPTAVAVMPAPRAQGTPGYFTGGSPGSGGYAATAVRYEFMNMLQEEIANVVLKAGLVLDKTDNGQLFEALQHLVRLKLFQDITLYVSTTGDDANDGATSGTALRTGQAAWNKAITLDLNGHNIVIQFANGTYTSPIICAGQVQGLAGNNGVSFIGNTGAPDLVVLHVSNANCITATNGAVITVAGITLIADGTFSAGTGIGLEASNAATINFNHMVFGACGTYHIGAWGSSVYCISAPYTINGSAMCHVAALNGSQIGLENSPVAVVGTPAFSDCFAQSSTATLYTGGSTFAGAATVVRFNAILNAVILTITPGSGLTTNPNYFPGNQPGVAQSGGQYE